MSNAAASRKRGSAKSLPINGSLREKVKMVMEMQLRETKFMSNPNTRAWLTTHPNMRKNPSIFTMNIADRHSIRTNRTHPRTQRVPRVF